MVSTDRTRRLELHLIDEQQTARLGAALAAVLEPGDTVLLRGPLGAGKSALARAVIGTLIGNPEAEIPSPSYTLVNVYETALGPVWHADLYRLSGETGEIEELGLDDAFGQALVLVEWPERIGAELPRRRAELSLSIADSGGRDVTVTLHGGGWESMIAVLREWT